jgi:hypothetical protein
VARPHRDRGIDLIVYLDRAARFSALPIQLKASTGTRFGAWRKFQVGEGLPRLRIMYLATVVCLISMPSLRSSP